MYHFHRSTLNAAAGIAGIMGYDTISGCTASDVMRRVTPNTVRTLAEAFPEVEPRCLLTSSGPTRLQNVWDDHVSDRKRARQWIY